MAAFLPKLYAEGFQPILSWGGNEVNKDGAISMPWPNYDELVIDFIHHASKECWCDYEYTQKNAGAMLEDGDFVRNSTLEQIKTMLTYCIRGERFCDGHWGSMIEKGHIRAILERLSQIQQENKLLSN